MGDVDNYGNSLVLHSISFCDVVLDQSLCFDSVGDCYFYIFNSLLAAVLAISTGKMAGNSFDRIGLI